MPNLSQIEEFITRTQPKSSQVRDVRVTKTYDNFVNGKMYFVEWTYDAPSPGGGTYQSNSTSYVFWDGRNFSVISRWSEFIQLVNSRIKHKSILEHLSGREFIAGAIAILLTVTICFMAFQRFDVPQILGNALTLILGFYFGVSQQKPTERSSGEEIN